MNTKIKVWIGALSAGALFFANLERYEGFREKPYLDSGKVATIGIGSTRYPDGRAVSMQDEPITREQAIDIAKAHIADDEAKFKSSLQGVSLSQQEYDLYLDFVYQYGSGAWRKSSMRRFLLQGNHVAACRALLRYRFVKGKDCRVRANNCYGVWTRQLARFNACMAVN